MQPRVFTATYFIQLAWKYFMLETWRTRHDLRDLVLLSKFGSQTHFSPLPLRLAYKCMFLWGCVRSLEGFLGIHKLALVELVQQLAPVLCWEEAPRDGELSQGTLLPSAGSGSSSTLCAGTAPLLPAGYRWWWTRWHFLGGDEEHVPEHIGRLP